MTMVVPDPKTTEWVPIWNPQNAGPAGPPGESTSVLFYRYDPSLSPPVGSGRIEFNTADLTVATLMRVSFTTDKGLDATLALMNVVATGTHLLFQDANDSTKFHKYSATAPATNQGSYAEIPVSWLSGSGVISNNQQCILGIAIPGPPGPTYTPPDFV